MTEGLMVEESESEVADDERREHERVDVDFPIQVQAPVQTRGRAIELSKGGIRIEVGEDLSHAMHVSFRFDLPGRSSPVGTLADIRWHEKTGSKADPTWIYGLRFSDLEPEEKSTIGAYLEELRADDDG